MRNEYNILKFGFATDKIGDNFQTSLSVIVQKYYR